MSLQKFVAGNKESILLLFISLLCACVRVCVRMPMYIYIVCVCVRALCIVSLIEIEKPLICMFARVCVCACFKR